MKAFGQGKTGEYIIDAKPSEAGPLGTFDVHFAVDRIMAETIKKNFYKTRKKLIGAKGFRNGHVPKGMVERMFGGEDKMYSASFLTYASAILVEQSPYKILHTYNMESSRGENGWWNVNFKAFLEPTADIDQSHLDMNFQIPKLEVDDYVLARQHQFAKMNPYLRNKMNENMGPIPAAEGDMVEIAVESSIDNVRFPDGCEKATRIRLVPGAVHPTSLYEKLLGSVPGLFFVLETSTPQDIPAFSNSIKGTFKMEVQILHVFTCDEPKIDDDLAISAGFDSLEKWTVSMRDSANRVNTAREEQLKRSLVLEHLAKTVPYPDFPEDWAAAKASELLHEGKIKVSAQELMQQLKIIAKQNTIVKKVGEYLGIEWEDAEKDIYSRNEQAYAEKVLQHLVTQKARFVYVDPRTERSAVSGRGNGAKGTGEEGPSSSNREELGSVVQNQI